MLPGRWYALIIAHDSLWRSSRTTVIRSGKLKSNPLLSIFGNRRSGTSDYWFHAERLAQAPSRNADDNG